MAQKGTLTVEAFAGVPGQIGPKSARALIAIQETITDWAGSYAYLDVGSYAGRSLLPHIRDPDCKYALSIDLRPEDVPDDRGINVDYSTISTAQMIAGLKKVCSPDSMEKLEAMTASSAEIGQRQSDHKFDLAFIDAEHTVRAAFTDFLNILPAMNEDCIIAFDDTLIVYPALEAASAYLDNVKTAHKLVYTRANIGCLQLGKYAEREMSIRPRMLCSPDEARTLYQDFMIKTARRQAAKGSAP